MCFFALSLGFKPYFAPFFHSHVSLGVRYPCLFPFLLPLRSLPVTSSYTIALFKFATLSIPVVEGRPCYFPTLPSILRGVVFAILIILIITSLLPSPTLYLQLLHVDNLSLDDSYLVFLVVHSAFFEFSLGKLYLCSMLFCTSLWLFTCLHVLSPSSTYRATFMTPAATRYCYAYTQSSHPLSHPRYLPFRRHRTITRCLISP